VELTVVNTGPVVPPYEIEAIFEPFRRLRGGRVGSERGPGSGCRSSGRSPPRTAAWS